MKDDRVEIDVDFTDEQLLSYMKLAHEQDITFNQFIEQTIRRFIQEDKEIL